MNFPLFIRLLLIGLFVGLCSSIGFSQVYKGVQVVQTTEGLSQFTFAVNATLSEEAATTLSTHFQTKEGIKSCSFTDLNESVVVVAKANFPISNLKDILAVNGYKIRPRT